MAVLQAYQTRSFIKSPEEAKKLQRETVGEEVGKDGTS